MSSSWPGGASVHGDGVGNMATSAKPRKEEKDNALDIRTDLKQSRDLLVCIFSYILVDNK